MACVRSSAASFAVVSRDARLPKIMKKPTSALGLKAGPAPNRVMALTLFGVLSAWSETATPRKPCEPDFRFLCRSNVKT
jgi:hypothetical protein